jgi:hypothetical protein
LSGAPNLPLLRSKIVDKITECIFSVAFDLTCAALRLFSPSKVMLTLIASSFSLFVASIVEVSEGERFAGREQMMEGTPSIFCRNLWIQTLKQRLQQIVRIQVLPQVQNV